MAVEFSNDFVTEDRQQRKWSLFLVVLVGVFMSTLDSSLANIALPAIMQEFQSPLTTTEWVVRVYLLTITVSLLFWGRLSDRLGRGRIYALGMLIFGTGSLCCGLASDIYWLIWWRFGQAIGAGMMMATGPAIIKETFPAARLGSKFGLVGIAVSLGLMTGPALGGLLVELFSWRSIFFITVPIGFVFSGIGLAVLPTAAPDGQPAPFDFMGASIWAVTVTLFLLGITLDAAAAFILIGLSFVGGIFFLWHETKTANPILPFHLFRKRFFSSAIICALLSFMVLFTAIILIPFYLDRVLVLPASEGGLVMMAIPLAVFVVSPLSGWLSDHIQARYLTTLGLVVSTASLFWLAHLTPQTSPAAVGLRLMLLGGGQATFLSPNSASVFRNMGNAQAGVSAGLLATVRNLGMLMGVVLAGLVFSFYFSRCTGGLDMKDFTPLHVTPFMTALKAALLTATAVSLAGAIISWFRGPANRNDLLPS